VEAEVKIGMVPTCTASNDTLGVIISNRIGVVTRDPPSSPVLCTRAEALKRRIERKENALPLQSPFPKLDTKFLHNHST
jgi:hypothetical protein